jgi:transposase
MENSSKVFVGLDVHKDSISIGVAQAGQQPARFVGKIAHDVPKLLKQLERIAPPAGMTIVYEAGPTGYGLQRALTHRGYDCQIIAPLADSAPPRRAGEDRPARLSALGRTDARGRAEGDLGAAARRRSDSQPGAST